jgi:hypothetical protein
MFEVKVGHSSGLERVGFEYDRTSEDSKRYSLPVLELEGIFSRGAVEIVLQSLVHLAPLFFVHCKGGLLG